MRRTNINLIIVIFLGLTSNNIFSDMACIEEEDHSWNKINSKVTFINNKYGSTSYLITNDSRVKIKRMLNSEITDFDKIVKLRRNYGPDKLFDSNKSTAWVEGVEGFGFNEGVIFFVEPNIESIEILNGFTRTKELFEDNNRIKEINIEIFTALPDTVTQCGAVFLLDKINTKKYELIDSMDFQKIDIIIPDNTLKEVTKKYKDISDELWRKKRLVIGLSIISVYKGNKYDDSCISEIKLNYK